MSFNIYQLDNLTYDQGEAILENYINDIIDLFINSPEGKAYIQEHEEGGNWIDHFIHLGYIYEEFTLPKMNLAKVKLLMEKIFPRKLTILDSSDLDDSISELVTFWEFLGREYKLSSAKAIIKYLRSQEQEFPRRMMDPSSGGFAKSFLLMAHQSGFDITTPEGLQEFQENYNANIASSLGNLKQLPLKEEDKPKTTTEEKVPKSMQAKFTEITELTDTFSQKYLNDEYAQMCRQLTAALCRKKSSPLVRGKANSWACGIVHAIGMVNFLYDPSQTPHIKATEIYKYFEVAKSTGQNKSRQIRDLMKMTHLSSEWCLPSQRKNHPSTLINQLFMETVSYWEE